MRLLPNESLAPWYVEGPNGPEALCVCFDLTGKQPFISPRQKREVLKKPVTMLVWDVPSCLSEAGSRWIRKVIFEESEVLRAGWKISKKGTLEFTPEAAQAKAGLDEYFAILARQDLCFVNLVKTAGQVVAELGEDGVRKLVAQEGDLFLAGIALGQRCLREQVKVLGDLHGELAKAFSASVLI